MCNVRVKTTTISTDEDYKNDEQRHGCAATEGKEYYTCSTSDAPPDQSVPPSSVKLDNMVSIVSCKLQGGVNN